MRDSTLVAAAAALSLAVLLTTVDTRRNPRVPDTQSAPDRAPAGSCDVGRSGGSDVAPPVCIQ